MAVFPHSEDNEVALTEGEVAAERRGKIPPHAIMMLSTICEMRWIVLWTKIMFSLLLTKSMTDLEEWLSGKEGKNWIIMGTGVFLHDISHNCNSS